MEIKRTIEIISRLADGNDPYTGEIFPKESSPYQHPDTVRALYEAMKALELLESNRRR